ncbi:MAG TPA: NUDIX domain-containing protein [Methylocella sp.]|nr:NUDIX domain-containing protein [Methylocella sp.]
MTGTIRILGRHLLSRRNGLLERFTVTRKRFDGAVQSLEREIYDTGDGVAILLYDPSRSRVVLVRQFRLAAFLRDGRDSLIEVCAGRLDGEDAESRVIKEAEEETGFIVRNPRRLFEAYMSPGFFAEKLTFFTAQYRAEDRTGKGGGLEHEGEDIEVLEPTLDEALAMIDRGEIVDAKTILLLHYAERMDLMRGNETIEESQAASP